MAAVLKSYISPQSLPVGMEKKMAGLQLLHPSVQCESSRVEELSELSGLIVQEEEEESEGDRDTDSEYDMVQREEAADMPLNFPRSAGNCVRSYGAISPSVRRSSRRGKKRRRRRRPGVSSQLFSPVAAPPFSLSPQAWRERSGEYAVHDRHRRYFSTSALAQEYGMEYERMMSDEESRSVDSDDDDEEDRHSNASSDEEDPPIIEMIYRRTCKDKTKLVVIPVLYFLFFVMAGVFAFYSIEALVHSYQHRVRTASYVTVDQYRPIGIAFFLQDFATYENCQFKYGDDLSPHTGNWTPLVPADNCSTSINVTFNSSLVNHTRTAMIFRGPTRVNLKQSLWLNFSVDTSARQFGAIEFLLLNSWDKLLHMTEAEQRSFLNLEEAKEPLHTVPAGFRSWVKMYYIIRNDGGSEANFSEFYINTDFSKYNDRRPIENRSTDPLVVLFEWKSPTYEYITDILSTTIWNTLGSLAGVFVTLIKAGEYFYAWIRRLRRERRKKLQKLQEIEEERQRLLAEFEERKEERRRQRQQSQEKLELDE